MQNSKPIWLKHTTLPKKISLEIDSYPTGTSQSKDIVKWQPQLTSLIKTPQYSRLVPPIFSKDYQKLVCNELKKRYKKTITIYLIATSVIITLQTLLSGLKNLSWPALLLLITLIHISEYKTGVKKVSCLKERSLFFYWLYKEGGTKLAILKVSSIFIIICLPQFILGKTNHPDYAFHLYGAVYSSIDEGEIWRILTGAYLHYSTLHFLTNFFLTLSVGVLSVRLLGMKSLLVFFLGNIIGVYSQYYFGSHELDSCGGVSFGFYSLFSFLIIYDIKRSRLFPAGFSLSLTLILLICFTLAELTLDNSASSGHIGSIIGGVILAKINLPHKFTRYRHV